MLDFLRPLRASLVAICFLLLCFVTLNTSSSFRSCIQQQQSQPTSVQNTKWLPDLRNWAIAQRACFGGFLHSRHDEILAAFTIILAIATIFLWFATRDLVTGAERTAERQLRAYVFVSSAAVTNITEGDGIPEAQVVIKNFGQTPAYKLANVSGFAANVYPPPKSLTLTVPDEDFSASISKSDLGPTQAETSTTDWKDKKRPLTQDEKAALAKGEAVIYVYGEIRYVDAFGHPQCTKYRYMMGGPVGLRPGGRLAPCEEGNEAT